MDAGKFDKKLMEKSLQDKPSVDASTLDAMNKMTSYGLGLKQLGSMIHPKDWVDPTENCWESGNFTDDCNCEDCFHKEECSGYTGDDD